MHKYYIYELNIWDSHVWLLSTPCTVSYMGKPLKQALPLIGKEDSKLNLSSPPTLPFISSKVFLISGLACTFYSGCLK